MSLNNQIKHKYELGDVSHMTDVSNLESILIENKIYSKNKMVTLDKTFVDRSNSSVQDGRGSIVVDCTGKSLHDYVPLYWGKMTPMVSALREHNETLIFLMFSTNLLEEYECVISDGNARANGTQFSKYQSLSDLDLLDAKCINARRYATDEEVKRRKQSELLVSDELPLKYLLRVICRTNDVKSKVEALLTTHGVKAGVCIGYHNYYYL